MVPGSLSEELLAIWRRVCCHDRPLTPTAMEEFAAGNPAVELVDEGKTMCEGRDNSNNNLHLDSSRLADGPGGLLHCNLPDCRHHPLHSLRHLLQTEAEEEIQLRSEEAQEHGNVLIPSPLLYSYFAQDNLLQTALFGADCVGWAKVCPRQ